MRYVRDLLNFLLRTEITVDLPYILALVLSHYRLRHLYWLGNCYLGVGLRHSSALHYFGLEGRLVGAYLFGRDWLMLSDL